MNQSKDRDEIFKIAQKCLKYKHFSRLHYQKHKIIIETCDSICLIIQTVGDSYFEVNWTDKLTMNDNVIRSLSCSNTKINNIKIYLLQNGDKEFDLNLSNGAHISIVIMDLLQHNALYGMSISFTSSNDALNNFVINKQIANISYLQNDKTKMGKINMNFNNTSNELNIYTDGIYTLDKLIIQNIVNKKIKTFKIINNKDIIITTINKNKYAIKRITDDAVTIFILLFSAEQKYLNYLLDKLYLFFISGQLLPELINVIGIYLFKKR